MNIRQIHVIFYEYAHQFVVPPPPQTHTCCLTLQMLISMGGEHQQTLQPCSSLIFSLSLSRNRWSSWSLWTLGWKKCELDPST